MSEEGTNGEKTGRDDGTRGAFNRGCGNCGENILEMIKVTLVSVPSNPEYGG